MSYFLLLLLTAFVAADWPDLEVDDCKQPPEYGSCHSHIRMWYYNRNTRSCKPFDYSSCGGNSNRFFTKSECFTHCAPQRTAPINH
ncbi:hypothetical protein AWZ03_008849 [Drosophila navojoa]|uniref:BPTI/Kunitz inhibitor domain-containing protein n=1 Tax=Drosophila navojoa TaxID=7232 RepID=A0A484B7P0_DRONA|nr:kunitz-type serine protease inhibitor homolog delta-dendrotoxin-like [Drosophila navojoa]TDG44708.1 hypothetical protein AWZ03_008849 [Drosophila navojoa]